MRWRSYDDGDWRDRTGFLWLPTWARDSDGVPRWRWLERASWAERYDGYVWRVKTWKSP